MAKSSPSVLITHAISQVKMATDMQVTVVASARAPSSTQLSSRSRLSRLMIRTSEAYSATRTLLLHRIIKYHMSKLASIADLVSNKMIDAFISRPVMNRRKSSATRAAEVTRVSALGESLAD